MEIRVMNLKFINIFIMANLLICVSPVAGEDEMRFNSADAGVLQLNSDDTVFNNNPDLALHIRDGALTIRRFLENPPQKRKPVFWLISDEKSLKTVLINALGLKSEEIRDFAFHAGYYRNENNIVIMIPGNTPQNWIQRIVLTEFSRDLLDDMAPRAASFPIGWFHSGFSSYLAWMAQGELEGQTRQEYEKDIRDYYGFSFDPEKTIALEDLESKDSWNAMLLENRALVYSQAVLSFLHLAEKAGLSTAPSILRLYNDEKVFALAFQRASGITLEEFESSLNNQYFSGFKPERKKVRP